MSHNFSLFVHKQLMTSQVRNVLVLVPQQSWQKISSKLQLWKGAPTKLVFICIHLVAIAKNKLHAEKFNHLNNAEVGKNVIYYYYSILGKENEI